jgi:hypothetical protein
MTYRKELPAACTTLYSKRMPACNLLGSLQEMHISQLDLLQASYYRKGRISLSSAPKTTASNFDQTAPRALITRKGYPPCSVAGQGRISNL